MHICFITSEFPKQGFPHGGVGTFVATLGKALIAKGIQVSVIGLNYTNKEETENIDGINVYRVVAKKQKGLQWYFNSRTLTNKIKEVHEQDTINIIETAELGLAFLPKIKGIKYVIRMHGGHHFLAENGKLNYWKALQEKLSFKKADSFIAVSNFVKDQTNKFLDFNDKYIEVIPNPVSVKKFKPSSTSFNKYSIVFVGTVYPKKGIENLMKSLKFIINEYPETHLNIYGREWFFKNKVSYTNFLKSKFDEKILKHVTFHGAVDHNDLPNVYQTSHLCVFPSFVESQGIVVIEAMASEKAVVFSKIPIGYETITPFETGLLIDPNDPKDIADKIIWFFEHPEQALEIGRNAREFVLQKFDVDIIVARNIEGYKRIISI